MTGLEAVCLSWERFLVMELSRKGESERADHMTRAGNAAVLSAITAYKKARDM